MQGMVLPAIWNRNTFHGESLVTCCQNLMIPLTHSHAKDKMKIIQKL